MEKEVSAKTYNKALDCFYQTSRMGGSPRLKGESLDNKSAQSKTQASGFWGSPDKPNRVSDQLANVHSKIEKGFMNSIMMKQQKMQRVREHSQRKPDLEALKKASEDESYGAWEKYLLKQKELVHKQKVN